MWLHFVECKMLVIDPFNQGMWHDFNSVLCREKKCLHSYIVKYKIHLTSIFKVSLCFLDNCTVITLEDLQHGCSAVKPHVIERSNFLSDLRIC